MRSLGHTAVLNILVTLTVLFTTTGCAANTAPPADNNPPSPSHTAAVEDIAEAVFRYQFDHNASALQKKAETYCLSLPGETMPSAEFLRRFQDNHPPVAAANQCERKGVKNLFLRVQKLDWHGDNEVWVRGGYWEGNLSSSVEMFRVVNEKGKWVVKGARMEAIS
jgi:hypothetical protein